MVLVPTSSSVGTGVRLDIGDQSKDLTIRENITIRSTDYDAIWAEGFNQKIIVAGYVRGADDGIDFGDSEFGQVLEVKGSGRVQGGEYAVQMAGDGSLITNAGVITSGNVAINMINIGNTLNKIVNSGSISAQDAAIVVVGSVKMQLINSGLISTSDDTNPTAYQGGSGRDVIRNTGTMDGRIYLGEGDDVYDGFQGRVTGFVNGGDGNDRFVPGNGSDNLNGSNGTDTLDYRKFGSVVVSLDGDFASNGAAKGDSFVAVERLYGSLTGNDRLEGTAIDDDLRGFGGADRLQGDAGEDRLYGGTGLDTLTGGAGLDDFVFASIKDIGDTITDWSSGPVLGVDQIYINSNFGGGLVDGLLETNQFRAKANNKAADADDRFIFDTTTGKLWFDRDGNGAAAAVMVALVKGDAMTYDDIIIF